MPTQYTVHVPIKGLIKVVVTDIGEDQAAEQSVTLVEEWVDRFNEAENTKLQVDYGGYPEIINWRAII